jgi:phage repressor protein C with HTH and peptisase S24 domain
MRERSRPGVATVRKVRTAGSRWVVRVVRGRSMQPTLRDGDRLLVQRDARTRIGALIVVRLPGGRPEAVKRVVHRQAGGWWVERDNPAEGVDSWLVGAIADDDVLGVVRGRLWPRPRRL